VTILKFKIKNCDFSHSCVAVDKISTDIEKTVIQRFTNVSGTIRFPDKTFPGQDLSQTRPFTITLPGKTFPGKPFHGRFPDRRFPDKLY